jgi:hypothetical protein
MLKFGYGMIGAAALAATALAIPAQAQPYGYGPGMMGPGYGYGMMGPGYGYGMMGRWGRGPGWMMRGYGYGPGWGMMGGYGPGMMGYGPGWGYGNQGNLNLTTDQVKNYFEHMIRNPNLKVGDVKEKDSDTITADIVTKQGDQLVQRIDVNRHNGYMQPEQ